MKIGILEIMPYGHYTLVDSVVRIYASDSNNQIYLFIHKNGEHNIKKLVSTFESQIRVIIWDGISSLKELFNAVNENELDKVFMITFEKFFKEFYSFKFDSELNIFIHNVDEWFYTNLKYTLYHLLKNISSYNEFIYRIKLNILYKKYKKKIVKRLLKNNGRFVVLNPFIKRELTKYLPENRVDVIPFSIYNDSLIDKSGNNKLFKICIPGMISETRRDYYSVLKLIEENLDFFSKNIEVELLGGIAYKEGGGNILQIIKKLVNKGAKIIYHEKPNVPINEFDAQLATCDIILGNIIVSVDKYSKYGKTKETGVPFTMIRAAKPGILPADYNVIEEVESSTIRFTNYTELKELLFDLINQKDKVNSLKQEAIKNSQKLSPKKLYHALMSKQS